MRQKVYTLFAGIGLIILAGSADAQNVLTGGYGNDRTNAALTETALNPGTVNSAAFGKLFILPVDGQIYAQPLFEQQVYISGSGIRNVVFVATMHNSVYAFDADAGGAPLWMVNLGTAVPAANYTSNDGTYTDITGENGILSTPVIDASTGTLYVVAANFEKGEYLYRLHALDVSSGAERFGGPTMISAKVSGTGDSSVDGVVPFVAEQHIQRPALLLANGNVYISFGAHGDAIPWHGWIMAYSASDLTRQSAVFNATPNGSGGSFWQSGRGLTADSAGMIYAVSSNGDTDNITNFSDNILKLTPALGIADWFGPSNVQMLDNNDDDLGSMGAILIPGTRYVLTGGKEGLVYVVDRENLGRQTDTNSQIAQTLNVTAFGNFNAALWGRSDGAVLYTHGSNEPVRSWKFDGRKFSAAPVSESTLGFGIPFQGMTVSANGVAGGTGILWVLRPASYPLPSQAELVAFDADDLSTVLWDSASSDNDAPGMFSKFANPTVANGRVYVPTQSNAVAVYGLKAKAGMRSSGGVADAVVGRPVRSNAGSSLDCGRNSMAKANCAGQP